MRDSREREVVEEERVVEASRVFRLGHGEVFCEIAMVDVVELSGEVFLPLVYGYGRCEVSGKEEMPWNEVDGVRRQRMVEAVGRGLPPLVATVVAFMSDEPLEEWPERPEQTILGIYGPPGTGKSLLACYLGQNKIPVADFDTFSKETLTSYSNKDEGTLTPAGLVVKGKALRAKKNRVAEPPKSLAELLISLANRYKTFTEPVLILDLPGRRRSRGADGFDVMASCSISCIAPEDFLGEDGKAIMMAYLRNLPGAIETACRNSALDDEVFRRAVMSWVE